MDKFDGGKDFELWKIKIHDVLVLRGEHKALLGKEKKPETMSDEEWDALDAKAKSTIRLCLADEVLLNVMRETTAADLWNKLESLYHTKPCLNPLLLKMRLYSLKMKEGTKMSEHLNAFNEIVSQLESVGVRMEEEDRVIQLLCTLPASYDDFMWNLCYGRTKLKMDDLMNALLWKELWMKAGNSENALVKENTGKSHRNGQTGRDRSKGRSEFRSKIRCYRCGMGGHMKRNCRNRVTTT